MNGVSFSVRRITISAVFLSISLVLKTTLTFDLPLFGQNGLRIGISGVFSILPALLFGPVYGAAVSGLSDFLGYLIKPVGGISSPADSDCSGRRLSQGASVAMAAR